MTLGTEGRKREPLKVKTVEAAGPREKDYKLPDTGGLYLFVSTSGHRSWRYKYRFGGKERRLVLGSFPDAWLKQARDMRDDAKQALRQGLAAEQAQRVDGVERLRSAGHLHYGKRAAELHALP